MAVYSPTQYQQLQMRRLAMLEKNARRGQILGAEEYAIRLRMMVPVKTGKLKRSINRKGNTVRVGATGEDGFPYVHWINQTPGKGMTNLLVKPKGRVRPRPWISIQGRPVLVKGGQMRYGSLPSTWRWTGEVRFAQKALLQTRNIWKGLIQKVNKKSIMVQSI